MSVLFLVVGLILMIQATKIKSSAKWFYIAIALYSVYRGVVYWKGW